MTKERVGVRYYRGVKYIPTISFSKKTEANDIAEHFRKQGKKARVVKLTGKNWEIWWVYVAGLPK